MTLDETAQDIKSQDDVDDNLVLDNPENEDIPDADQLDENSNEDSNSGDEEDKVEEVQFIEFQDETLQVSKEPDSSESSQFRELRNQNRALNKKLREVERQLASQQSTVETQTSLGPAPRIVDFDDEESFSVAHEKWILEKHARDLKALQEQDELQAQKKAFEEKVATYKKNKENLNFQDFEEAEELVESLFDAKQQAVLIDNSEKLELLIYALGKSPEKAKKLASIKNLGKFIFEAGKLEAQLKMTTRKQTAPPPETKVKSSGTNSSSMKSSSSLGEKEILKKVGNSADITELARFYRNQNRSANTPMR